MPKRKVADLIIKQEIMLFKALTGCKLSIEFLYGNKLQVDSQGRMIRPNAVMIMECQCIICQIGLTISLLF